MYKVRYFNEEPHVAVYELEQWFKENPSIQVISSNMSVIKNGHRDLMRIVVIYQGNDSNPCPWFK